MWSSRWSAWRRSAQAELDAEQLADLAQLLYPATQMSAAAIGPDEGRFREALEPVGVAA